MNEIFISIIIPTYNRAHLIKETIDSIIAQSYNNWECLVIDDGSTDDTSQIVENYCKKDQRFHFYERPKNKLKGANACRNFGLEKAIGEYIQWFDSDDLMHPDLLKLQLENIQNTGKLISFCNFSFFRVSKEINTVKGFNSFKGLTSGQKLLTEFVSGQLVLNTQISLFHKSIVDNISFNENLHRAQDLDFVFRILVSNLDKVTLLDEKLVYVRRHEQSITDNFKNRDLQLINSEIFVRKMIWQVLVSHNFPNESVQGAIKMYLQSLKYLLYTQEYLIFFNKTGNAFLNVNIKLKFEIIKLSMLALFYIFTKKGITAYQRVLNKL